MTTPHIEKKQDDIQRLQLKVALSNAEQDIKILKKAIDDLVRENVELRIKLSRMELA